MVENLYVLNIRRSWRTAEIAFGTSSVEIVRDSRLRECGYGGLTGRPLTDIAVLRGRAVAEPFPGGESYSQVVARMIPWLEEIRSHHVRQLLVIGHRATHYTLEHLLLGTPLIEAVCQPFTWQPGWVYRHPGRTSDSRATSRRQELAIGAAESAPGVAAGSAGVWTTGGRCRSCQRGGPGGLNLSAT